jgi:hypothetical protein
MANFSNRSCNDASVSQRVLISVGKLRALHDDGEIDLL